MGNKSKKTKYIVLSLSILVIGVFVGGYYWYTQYKQPHDKAVSEFNATKKVVEAENKKLDDSISSAQKIIDSKEVAFDENVLPELNTMVSAAKQSRRTVPTLPKATNEIIETADKLKEPIDYSKEIANLKEQQLKAENSIKVYKQLTNPTSDFVISRVKEVQSVVAAEPVTEDNDPNGQLNKAGGYTATVYFSSSIVDPNDVYGNTLIDQGTDAGGCIEVYRNVEDAQKRNTYLAAFDGSVISSGSHNVVGTMVVRTSSKLTATQQKSLEDSIVDKLTALQ